MTEENQTRILETVPELEEKGTLVFKKIKEGDDWEELVIQGNRLLVGVFSNADLPKKELTGHREIAAPRVDLHNNKVTVRILDGIQDDTGDLTAFKKALAESNKTHSYDAIRQTDVCMSEIRVDLDLANKTLKSSLGTSESLGYWGNKCFLARGKDIFDCSNVKLAKKLESGDVIFVLSNNVLRRLIEENIGANSNAATQEYLDAALISEVKTLLSGAIDKGHFDQNELFNKLSDMYFESRVDGQNGIVACAYVAYQIP
jgi:hypothetical protein